MILKTNPYTAGIVRIQAREYKMQFNMILPKAGLTLAFAVADFGLLW